MWIAVWTRAEEIKNGVTGWREERGEKWNLVNLIFPFLFFPEIFCDEIPKFLQEIRNLSFFCEFY